MGADATLVNMAYAASMANVPGNYSSSFNKQYEGLIASHKAQMGLVGTAAQAVGVISGSIAKRKEAEKESIFARTSLDAIGELANQNAQQSAAQTAKVVGENGQILANQDVVTAASDEMQGIKDGLGQISQQSEDAETMKAYQTELLDINKKNFRNKKNKARRDELYRKVDILKANLINEKVATTTYIRGVNDGQYNLNITDKDNKDLTTLRAQVSSSDSNFKNLGIRAFRENGKLMYEYTEGRLGAQYNANLRGPDPSETEEGPAVKKVISHEELFGKMVPKALETQGALELSIYNNAGKAEEVIKNKDGGKSYKYESFTSGGAFSLENQVYDEMVNNIYNSKGDPSQIVQDLSDRNMKGRNYGKDILKGISNSTYEEFGISPSEIAAADTNNDGFIGDNPNTKQIETGETLLEEEDLKQLHEMLTNPVGEEQTKHAVSAIASWWTNLAEQEFNHVRGIMDAAVSPGKKGGGGGGKDKKSWFGSGDSLAVQGGNRFLDYDIAVDAYDAFSLAKDKKAASFNMFNVKYDYNPQANNWTDGETDFGNSDQFRKSLGISEPDFKALTVDAAVKQTGKDEVVKFGDQSPAIKTNKLIFTDIDVGDDDDAAENLNKRFGLNRRSDVMFAPYSKSNVQTYAQTGLSGIGTGLLNSDALYTNDIMMYDPIKKEPIKIDGKIVRFKTGDDAFVKGDDPNPTADEIIKFLKEKFNIEYDPLKPIK